MSRDTEADTEIQNEPSRDDGNSTHQDGRFRLESLNTMQPLTTHRNSNKDLQREPTRNEQFDPEWEPFRDNHALQLNDEEVDGAVWFMNPTRAMFTYLGSAELIWDDQGSEQYISREGQEYADSHTADIQYKWTSRNNRKGRHALVVHQSEEHYDTPPPVNSFHSIIRGIWRMATVFAFWDISYLTAVIFTVAVAVLMVNAILAMMPYTNPSWAPPPGILIGEGVLTVAGCVLFLLSSFLSWVEAVNANRRGCFGWKREHISYHDADDSRIEHGAATRMVPDRQCVHRTNNFANLFRYSEKSKPHPEKSDFHTDNLFNSKTQDSSQDKDQWRWFPTNDELWKHFIYDLGFVTCTILLLSSLIYCSAGVASIVSIAALGGKVSHWIRIPQLIAGIGFAVSSMLFMLETQTYWVPDLRVIGWHISFWNFLGSVGFTLCAAFALAGAEPKGRWAEYQFVYSYMWGSVGFLIGSMIQWYEALDKHPVKVLKRHSQKGE